MATYTVGDGAGADYADFELAEADLTFPEAGGTIYEITGTITPGAGVDTINQDYSNGLTIRAKAGEEADGLGGGTARHLNRLNMKVTTTAVNIEKIRFDSMLATDSGIEVYFDDCDIGVGSSGDEGLTVGTDTIGQATNCIFRNCDDDSVRCSAANTGFIVHQCTSVDADGYGFMRCLMTQCLSIGSVANDDFFGEATGSDYNASEDSSAGNANDITGRSTTDLENYAGGNYNLASGSSLNTDGPASSRIGALIIVASSTNSKGPLGHPIKGAFGGPI